jgi:hypothetical protein
MNLDVLLAEANHSVREHVRDLESQNTQLYHQLNFCQQELSGFQGALQDSQVQIKNLEARAEDLELRRQSAVSTLFRLKPQRQDCTETEIKDDYQSLKDSIEKWVNTNCEAFLDNEQLSYDRIEGNISGDRDRVKDYEIILHNFRSQSDRWNDAKDQVLISIIMRRVFYYILRPSFPAWLSKENVSLLHEIEKNLENLEPKRGKSQPSFRKIIVNGSIPDRSSYTSQLEK